MGDTWYDSLQIKVTKRFSHGLSAQVAYTWQKELTNGTNSNTSYVTPSPPLINDVFNHQQNKQISGFSQPQTLIISFNYTTPKIACRDGTALKALSWAVRDWTIGGVLRYQSGQIIRTPSSANNLLANLAARTVQQSRHLGRRLYVHEPGARPAAVPGGSELPEFRSHQATRVESQPPGPSRPSGTFGTSAPYYNDYRWQRQPTESLAIGRGFPNRQRRPLHNSGPGGIPEHLQPPFYTLPTGSGSTSSRPPPAVRTA